MIVTQLEPTRHAGGATEPKHQMHPLAGTGTFQRLEAIGCQRAA